MAPREHVPTVPELGALGLARQVSEQVGKQTRVYWVVSEEGNKILSDVMRRNGQRAVEWNRRQAAEAG